MIVAVILAAGTSSRLGRPKQLLQLGEQTVIEHVVDRVLVSSVDHVLVVLGHGADAIEAVLQGRDIAIVRNPEYRDGQGTSLVAGIKAAQDLFDVSPDQRNAVVMMLVDQPSTRSTVIDRVISVWSESDAPIALARYGTHRSHPVIFDERVLPELLEVTGDEGARSILRRYGDKVVEVDSGEADLPPDIDTEEAYRHMVQNWSAQEPNAP